MTRGSSDGGRCKLRGMDLSPYSARLKEPVKAKLPDLASPERLYHMIFADQLTPHILNKLFRSADSIREISRSREGLLFLRTILADKRAMLYFTQTSTRTFLSFVGACQLLGMPYAEVRDPSISSEAKGEHPLDSMRMFSSYFDLIIIRDKHPGFAESCAYMMNDLRRVHRRGVPIVNGGSGADEHPTQALLDLFTIQRSFDFAAPTDTDHSSRYEDLRGRHPGLRKGMAGKKYVFCGDIGRGRTVRSLALLLARYPSVELHFVAPPIEGLRLSGELKSRLIRAGAEVFEHSSLDAVVGEADLVYMTRAQKEHDKSGAAGVDWGDFVLTPSRLDKMKEYAPVLHPFPRNEEIPFEIDEDPRAMYFRQARNGMWVRAALLAHLFDAEAAITEYHQTEYATFHDYNSSVL